MNTASAAPAPPGAAPRSPWWIVGAEHTRTFRIVTVQVNDRCPLRCKHCCVGYSSESKGSGWRISESELREIIAAVDPEVYIGVGFAGGEPSIDPDLVRLGSDACYERGLSATIVTAPVWAASPAAAAKFLDNQPHLDRVVLSYDRYHLDFLKVSHYANAIRAALVREREVCLHICYAEKEELDEMLRPLSAFRRFVPVVASPVVAVGNAVKLEADLQLSHVRINAAADLDRIPRKCVVGQAFIGTREKTVHGCCWAYTVPRSPITLPKRGDGLAATLTELEAKPLMQALVARGFLDSLSPHGRELLARRMKGRVFASECDICLACMRDNTDEVWRECEPAPARA